MPSPIMSMSRTAQPSPVPAHTTLGLVCDTARDPIAWDDSLSNVGFHVVPPSLDFHTPPDAAAAQKPPGWPATAAAAAIRPAGTGPAYSKCGAGTFRAGCG